jgi:ribonuclease VapC
MTVARPAPIDLVVDTSAVVAMILDEPSAPEILTALEAACGAVMSAGTLTELLIVATARTGAPAERTTALVDDLDIVIMPVDQRTAAAAHLAWERFGKGNHPAGLNYGDCFAYALAELLDVPILCTGDDFARTDLATVPS